MIGWHMQQFNTPILLWFPFQFVIVPCLLHPQVRCHYLIFQILRCCVVSMAVRTYDDHDMASGQRVCQRGKRKWNEIEKWKNLIYFSFFCSLSWALLMVLATEAIFFNYIYTCSQRKTVAKLICAFKNILYSQHNANTNCCIFFFFLKCILWLSKGSEIPSHHLEGPDCGYVRIK